MRKITILILFMFSSIFGFSQYTIDLDYGYYFDDVAWAWDTSTMVFNERYYYDSDAPAGGTGTKASPFNNITDNNLFRRNNVAHYFKYGSEFNNVPRIQMLYNTSGDAEYHDIMLAAYGNPADGKPLLWKSSGNAQSVEIAGCNYIFIRDLHFRNNVNQHIIHIQSKWEEDDQQNVTYRAYSHNIQIVNCELETGYNGVRIINNNNSIVQQWKIRIDSCTIYNIKEDGIIGSADTIYITRNDIEKVNMGWHLDPIHGHDQSYWGGDGVQLTSSNPCYINGNDIDRRYTGNKFGFIYGGFGTNVYIEVGDNTFYPPKDTTDDMGGAALGVYWASAGDSLVVANNVFDGSTDVDGNVAGAVMDWKTNNALFVNNVFYDINGLSTGNEPNVARWYYNTFVNFGQVDFNNHVNIPDFYLKNNIFAGSYPYFRGGTVKDSSDNYVYSGGTWGDWDTYFGFVDVENGNWHLDTLAPMIGKALDIGVNIDIDGDSRTADDSPDVGADEYVYVGGSPPTYYDLTIVNGKPSGQYEAGDIVTIIFEATIEQPHEFCYWADSVTYLNDFQDDTTTITMPAWDQTVTGVYDIYPTIDPGIELPHGLIDEDDPNSTIVVDYINPGDVWHPSGTAATISIVGGNDDNIFGIDGNRNMIISDNTNLDFESTSVYEIEVMVQTDSCQTLTDTATYYISIDDVNEAPVINNQTFSVNEYAIVGTVVGTILYTDPDTKTPLFQDNELSITAGNTGSAFAISNNQLVVLTQAAVTGTFNLTIRVADSGTPTLYDEATITVNTVASGAITIPNLITD